AGTLAPAPGGARAGHSFHRSLLRHTSFRLSPPLKTHSATSAPILVPSKAAACESSRRFLRGSLPAPSTWPQQLRLLVSAQDPTSVLSRHLAGVYLERHHPLNAETAKWLWVSAIACGFAGQNCITP